MQRVQPHLHIAEGNVFELTEAEDKAPMVAMDALSTEQVLAKMMEAMAGDGTGSPTQMKTQWTEMKMLRVMMTQCGHHREALI